MDKKIYWAGDSTVANNDFSTYPQTGIGQVMNLFLDKEINVHNHAKNGRSTKSFINQSRLAKIYSQIREGDFLFIQFGHNDSKVDDPSRYSEAYGDYQVNLEKFINVARNRNAYPVLISPVCRRWFDENNLLMKNIHEDYPAAMRAVAKKFDVAYIDLYDLSKSLLCEWGSEVSKKYFMADKTHLTHGGAVEFARLIALGLHSLGGEYIKLLNKSLIL